MGPDDKPEIPEIKVVLTAEVCSRRYGGSGVLFTVLWTDEMVSQVFIRDEELVRWLKGLKPTRMDDKKEAE